MLLGDKSAWGPGDFPSLQEPCRSERRVSPASLAPEPPRQRPGLLAVFSVWRVPGTALTWRPAYPVDSSSREVPVAGRWGLELAVAARAAESLEVAGESLRGLRRVAAVSEGLGAIVEWAEASVRTMADKEGLLVTVWAPEAEAEGSGVIGGSPGAPGGAGGRVEAPGGIEGPGEGWEAPGSPRNVPSGPKGGEGEAWAPEGLVGKVCALDRFILRWSWRTWSTDF